jgi:hypothetical protein
MVATAERGGSAADAGTGLEHHFFEARHQFATDGSAVAADLLAQHDIERIDMRRHDGCNDLGTFGIQAVFEIVAQVMRDRGDQRIGNA